MKLAKVPGAPKWLKREVKPGATGRFVIYEKNQLFQVSGAGRRMWVMPPEVTTLKEATLHGERKRQEWMGRGATTKLSLKTFQSVWDEYLLSKKAGWAATTMSDAIQRGSLIRDYFNRKFPYIRDLNTLTAAMFLEDFAKENPTYKRAQLRKYLLAMASYALDQGYLQRPVKIPLRGLDGYEEAGREILPDEAEALLKAARGNPELYAQITIGLYCGMRRKEVCGLKWEQFDMERRTIALATGSVKTRRGRAFPIADAVVKAVKALPKSSVWLFPNPSGTGPILDNKTAWSRCRREAKVKCRFHDLRVTAITRALRAGMQDTKISTYFGVSLETLKERYYKARGNDLEAIANVSANIVRMTKPWKGKNGTSK